MSPIISGGGSSGGGSSAVSDIIICEGGVVLTTDNDWGWTALTSDLAISSQRGTDMSIVDGTEDGEAGLHTVDGGDFSMMVMFHTVVTLDGGSSAQRWLKAIADGSPDSTFSSLGLDAIQPLLAGNHRDSALAQPWFGVPADGLVTDILMQLICVNATGTDSLGVGVTLTLQKLGPLPS